LIKFILSTVVVSVFMAALLMLFVFMFAILIDAYFDTEDGIEDEPVLFKITLKPNKGDDKNDSI